MKRAYITIVKLVPPENRPRAPSSIWLVVIIAVIIPTPKDSAEPTSPVVIVIVVATAENPTLTAMLVIVIVVGQSGN